MKHLKFIIGGAALLGIIGVFLTWVNIEGAIPKLLGPDAIPTSGMDNGGPVFIFLLALPLIAAVIGILKRFGRGLAVLALVGGLAATFMGLVKGADIDDAAAELKKLGGAATLSYAPGYWVCFIASCIVLVVSIVALIKPEPKPATAA
jgi:hypothetical protein